MSVPETIQPADPQGQLLFLLGGMDAKIDGVAREQAAQRTEAVEFRAEVRNDVQGLRSDIGNVVARVDVIESKQAPRTPWYAIAGGIGSLIAISIGVVTLLKVLNP